MGFGLKASRLAAAQGKQRPPQLNSWPSVAPASGDIVSEHLLKLFAGLVQGQRFGSRKGAGERKELSGVKVRIANFEGVDFKLE